MKSKSGERFSGEGKKSFSSSLRVYENSEYSIQQKAQFVYYLSIAMIGLLILLLTYTVYLQLTSPLYGKLYYPVLIPEVAILMITILCHILLIRGYFNISVHLLLISTMTITWIGILMDRGDALSRLDSIVFILGLLTTLPLLIKSYKRAIILYTIVNLGALFIFTGILQKELLLPDSTIIDYLADTSIAFIFIGLVGFFIFRINKQTLEKAVADLNSRLSAEKALSDSENKFREMTDLLPQSVFETDITGRITYINKSGKNLFQYTEEDFMNNINMLSFISANDRERAGINFRLLLKEELNPNNLYTGLKKDGSQIPLQIFSRPIILNGEVAGIRGIAVDITERIEAENIIRKSRDQFQSLVANIPGITYRCLCKEKCILGFISPEIEKLNGYSSDNFVNKGITRFRKLIHPEDSDMVEQKVEEAKQSGKSWEIEYRILHKNDTIRWVYEKGRPIFDSEGSVEYLDGFILDITDRKNAGKSLSESERKYRVLFENAQMGIYQTTPEGNILNVNPAILEMTGYGSLDEIKEMNLEKYAHLSRRSEFKTLIEKNGYVKNFETNWITKTGEELTVIENASIVRNNNGKTLYYDGFVENITERKKSESELEKHRNKLEILVIERTEELEAINEELRSTNDELFNQRQELGDALISLQEAQNKLIQSEKMASIGILAAGVAHEINNPLNFIQGGILGLEDYFKENLEEHMGKVSPLIEAVRTGVRRSANIVASLKHYSRTNELVRSECDLNFIIENCLTILNNQLKHKIEIVKHYTDATYLLTGNEGKLHQAFLNVISNAAHSIESSGRIIIKTILEDNFIVATIEDTGYGISDKDLDRIFDPFFTTKEPGKGVGLGLSITYNIIQEHNGTIEFESKIDKGTKVIIRLPLETK